MWLCKLGSRRVQAFGLIEVSFVLIIVGLLTATFLQQFKTYQDISRKKITQENQEYVLQALGRHMRYYNFLPMPAKHHLPEIDCRHGWENIHTDDPVFYNDMVSNKHMIDAGAAWGAIPYRQLNIPKSKTLDGYGRPMTYIMTKMYRSYSKFNRTDLMDPFRAGEHCCLFFHHNVIRDKERKPIYEAPVTSLYLVEKHRFPGVEYNHEDYVHDAPTFHKSDQSEYEHIHVVLHDPAVVVLVSHGKKCQTALSAHMPCVLKDRPRPLDRPQDVRDKKKEIYILPTIKAKTVTLDAPDHTIKAVRQLEFTHTYMKTSCLSYRECFDIRYFRPKDASFFTMNPYHEYRWRLFYHNETKASLTSRHILGPHTNGSQYVHPKSLFENEVAPRLPIGSMGTHTGCYDIEDKSQTTCRIGLTSYENDTYTQKSLGITGKTMKERKKQREALLHQWKEEKKAPATLQDTPHTHQYSINQNTIGKQSSKETVKKKASKIPWEDMETSHTLGEEDAVTQGMKYQDEDIYASDTEDAQ